MFEVINGQIKTVTVRKARQKLQVEVEVAEVEHFP